MKDTKKIARILARAFDDSRRTAEVHYFEAASGEVIEIQIGKRIRRSIHEHYDIEKASGPAAGTICGCCNGTGRA